jgi:2-oxoglutarate ferredoxin oxidoreductase subunit gamma
MVIFSSQEISCPLIGQGDVLVVLENTQIKLFEGRVKPGGLIILESTGPFKVDRGDVDLIPVPALKIASSLGEILVANLVLLGAYIQATKILPPEYIEREVETRFGVSETGIRAAERHPLLQLNLDAFKRGLDYKG